MFWFILATVGDLQCVNKEFIWQFLTVIIREGCRDLAAILNLALRCTRKEMEFYCIEKEICPKFFLFFLWNCLYFRSNVYKWIWRVFCLSNSVNLCSNKLVISMYDIGLTCADRCLYKVLICWQRNRVN